MHDDGLDQYEDCNITKQNQAGGLSQDLQSPAGRVTHHEESGETQPANLPRWLDEGWK
jgi:hypothetical protein